MHKHDLNIPSSPHNHYYESVEVYPFPKGFMVAYEGDCPKRWSPTGKKCMTDKGLLPIASKD